MRVLFMKEFSSVHVLVHAFNIRHVGTSQVDTAGARGKSSLQVERLGVILVDLESDSDSEVLLQLQ